LKFYASVRLDIRRIGAIKDGQEVIGNRTRVKVVKNKCAPPFRQAEFDIMYNEGVSHLGLLVDLGVEHGIVEKSGSWFSYGDLRLGQGKENSKVFFHENQDIADEVEVRLRSALGLTQDEAEVAEEAVTEAGETSEGAAN
jgi:recombination protein RecA